MTNRTIINIEFLPGPSTDARVHPWINIHRGEDGSMQLEKQPFDSWPGWTEREGAVRSGCAAR